MTENQNNRKKTITQYFPENRSKMEICFVSPAVITIQKDNSVEIALDLRKLNEAWIKRIAAMRKMDEMISKISAQITNNKEETWMSEIDLVYAYGHAKRSKVVAKHCVFSIVGVDFTGQYRFKKRFYGLLDPNRIPGTQRQSFGIQNTGLARSHHMRNKRYQ